MPSNEPQRLADLRAHQILDTPADRAFDDLAALAAEICGTPMAMVSLVDQDRQWFKSRIGIDACQTARDISFCSHTILEPDMLVVEDAAQDERFGDNPLVTGQPGLRFYAGVPLRSASGHALGTLCVADTQPRALSPQIRQRLRLLAGQVSRQLQMHRLLADTTGSATRDALTGLASRAGLLDEVDAALRRSVRGELPLIALAFIDLDRFKLVNDSYGQEAGNAVLQAVGGRLTEAVVAIGESSGLGASCVARLGGDEFVVMVAGDLAAEWARTELPGRLIDAVARPVAWNGRELPCSCSCGLSFSQQTSAEGMLREADIAMYRAKREGGRRSSAFAQQMRTELVTQVELEADLRRAIDEGHITAAYQPIIDLNDSRLAGVETLARWNHPRRGFIPPPLFIDLAERSGLIDDLFDRIADQSLRTFARLREQPGGPGWVSLNLSRLQLLDEGLCGRLVKLIEAAGVDRSAVHLEITESVVNDSDRVISQLHRLRDAGLTLMLDDFGVGASTLSCLHRFPISWLKIDHHFMHNALERRDLTAVLHAIAQLAQNLNLRLVAEGIEQREQIPLLQAMDIGYGQGYHFSKPVNAELIERWCAQRHLEASPRAA